MKLATAFISLVLVAGTIASGQEFFFRQYTGEEGLIHSFIYDINQDPEGYMWIGTGEGLYRFDGLDFEYLTTEDGLGDNFITKIFKDKKGSLWIGHQNGVITTLSGKKFNLLNENIGAQGAVMDIIQDGHGNIWAAVQNLGLISIGSDMELKPVGFPVEHDPISQIEYLSKNQFLIGSQENLYLSEFRKDADSMIIIDRIEAYPGSKVVDILTDSAGRYVVVSLEDGIFSCDIDRLTSRYSFSVIDDNRDGILDNLQGGIIDGMGTLWVNSLGNGLIEYRKTKNNMFSRAGRLSMMNGLVSDDVRTVFEDAEGNLWLGMYGDGLLRYVKNNLTFYHYPLQPESSTTYTVTGNEEGLFAVVGNSLLKIALEGNTVLESYKLPKKQSGDRVKNAYLAEDGKLWLGFEESGLFVAEPPGFSLKPVFISHNELANSLNHITGQEGVIWVSTKKGICRISAGTHQITWYTTDQGLPHNNIQQLHIDNQNRILIATLCSEIHYIDGQGEIVRLENSRIGSFSSVMSISVDRSGAIWIGTEGNGVWNIDEGENENYTRSTGLLSDFCYSLTQTDDGMLVVGHRGGISRIDPQTGSIRTFGQHDGIKSATELFPNAIFSDPFGQIWFGSSEGLLKYSTNLSSGGMASPKLQIGSLYVDGERVDHTTGQVSLKPGYYELAIEYIGIHLTNPEMVKYQTKLEGYNKNWSALTSDRRVVYDRVGHGSYSFKIRAFNENNVESEISSGFELIIKKPLYRSIWFNAVVIIMLVLLAYTIIRRREKNLRTEQERLLKKIDEKTKDLIVKEEIIKERKKVEKVLIEAKTKAELSEKLKTSFLQNMSHEIRTPMNAVVGFSELLLKNTKVDSKQTEFIDVIHTNAENLLTIIDDILDVSQLESNQLKMREGNCKVDVLIESLKAKYVGVLKHKGKTDIKLIAKLPDENGLEMRTDQARLQQVLNKLLDNAVKFTESGSITFGYEPEDEHVTFFVEDTGIGLSEDKAGIIFDLFRKVEDDKVKLYGGTGLGLTLSRYLVHLLGGKIDVKSAENEGSRFYFDLPYIPCTQKSDVPNSINRKNEFRGTWKGKKVLVVEDTDSNYKLIDQVLKPMEISIERLRTVKLPWKSISGMVPLT
jgi:signal transduction histidine kinase/streptogramin lyase